MRAGAPLPSGGALDGLNYRSRVATSKMPVHHPTAASPASRIQRRNQSAAVCARKRAVISRAEAPSAREDRVPEPSTWLRVSFGLGEKGVGATDWGESQRSGY